MPPAITPEGFQTQQSFVSGAAPKLAGTLEAALRLPAGRFNGSAADRFTGMSCRSVIHPLFMFLEVIKLFGHRLGTGSFGQFSQNILKLPNDFDCALVLELLGQWLKPSLELILVFSKQSLAHRRQMLHRMIEIQPLTGLRKPVIGQTPNPYRSVSDHQRSGCLT